MLVVKLEGRHVGTAPDMFPHEHSTLHHTLLAVRTSVVNHSRPNVAKLVLVFLELQPMGRPEMVGGHPVVGECHWTELALDLAPVDPLLEAGRHCTLRLG